MPIPGNEPVTPINDPVCEALISVPDQILISRNSGGFDYQYSSLYEGLNLLISDLGIPTVQGLIDEDFAPGAQGALDIRPDSDFLIGLNGGTPLGNKINIQNNIVNGKTFFLWGDENYFYVPRIAQSAGGNAEEDGRLEAIREGAAGYYYASALLASAAGFQLLRNGATTGNLFDIIFGWYFLYAAEGYMRGFYTLAFDLQFDWDAFIEGTAVSLPDGSLGFLRSDGIVNGASATVAFGGVGNADFDALRIGGANHLELVNHRDTRTAIDQIFRTLGVPLR